MNSAKSRVELVVAIEHYLNSENEILRGACPKLRHGAQEDIPKSRCPSETFAVGAQGRRRRVILPTLAPLHRSRIVFIQSAHLISSEQCPSHDEGLSMI